LFHPWWKSGAITLRPISGIRYMLLREALKFKGIDGGPSLFTSYMNTKTRTHLVGPEIGLQAEMGGDSFKIVAVSRFILFANIEKLRLEGDNYGTAAQVNLGAINSFSQTITNAHLSPAFEQTVHVEAKLLQFVPFVNRVDLFREASFRVGFTFFNVAEVARPGRSVRHRGLPQTPELVTDRSKWSFLSWDLGVLFKY